MKVFPVIIATVGFFLNVSCEKPATTNSPKTSNSPAGSTEPQLIESKKQLETEITSQRMRIMELESDISELKLDLADLRPKMELLDAEKKQMSNDAMKLRNRWAKEIEGIHGEPSRPIHEQFRMLIERMDQLLQENQELKRKLEATAK